MRRALVIPLLFCTAAVVVALPMSRLADLADRFAWRLGRWTSRSAWG